MWTSGILSTRYVSDRNLRVLDGREVEVIGTHTIQHPAGPYVMANVILTDTFRLLTIPAAFVCQIETRWAETC